MYLTVHEGVPISQSNRSCIDILKRMEEPIIATSMVVSGDSCQRIYQGAETDRSFDRIPVAK